jgi:hypothetical protein
VVEQGKEEVLDGGVGAVAERNQEREKRAAALQGTGKLCA